MEKVLVILGIVTIIVLLAGNIVLGFEIRKLVNENYELLRDINGGASSIATTSYDWGVAQGQDKGGKFEWIGGVSYK